MVEGLKGGWWVGADVRRCPASHAAAAGKGGKSCHAWAREAVGAGGGGAAGAWPHSTHACACRHIKGITWRGFKGGCSCARRGPASERQAAAPGQAHARLPGSRCWQQWQQLVLPGAGRWRWLRPPDACVRAAGSARSCMAGAGTGHVGGLRCLPMQQQHPASHHRACDSGPAVASAARWPAGGRLQQILACHRPHHERQLTATTHRSRCTAADASHRSGGA